MCISIPVAKRTSSKPSWIQQELFDRPRRLFMLGMLGQIFVFLFVPIGLFSSAIITVNMLLMASLAFMVEDHSKSARGPMSPLRAAFGFWFVFPGGAAALLGGPALYIGCAAALFGSYLIIGEWLQRRR